MILSTSEALRLSCYDLLLRPPVALSSWLRIQLAVILMIIKGKSLSRKISHLLILITLQLLQQSLQSFSSLSFFNLFTTTSFTHSCLFRLQPTNSPTCSPRPSSLFSLPLPLSSRLPSSPLPRMSRRDRSTRASSFAVTRAWPTATLSTSTLDSAVSIWSPRGRSSQLTCV